ncbi:hypothetical protein ACL07V_06970 [Streptomyces sp. MB22_4]|uniref:hypothetical protein n=1 Tax=Streptomyces sp. MB22_4 TaxID=3383120 RepID=UPI0039A33521
MAPPATVALAGTDPRHAGAASGVPSTADQAGGAIGLAAVGVVFYRALGRGTGPDAFADAFRATATAAPLREVPRFHDDIDGTGSDVVHYPLVPFALGVAALVQLFPRPSKKAPTA